MADLIYHISAMIALAAVFLAFFRLLKGPTVADRVVALDGMTIISISMIVFISFYLRRAIYLDVASVYALISFVGVVAVARYIEKGI